MIPDGMGETSAAENDSASFVVEVPNNSETMTATGTAECREDEVLTTEENRDDNAEQKNNEFVLEETAEEDSYVSQQRCLTSSSEVCAGDNDACDNSMKVDVVASSHSITDGKPKPSSEDAKNEKPSEDDGQPTSVVEDNIERNDSHVATANEADTFHQDTASEQLSNETNAGVTAEEEASCIGHGSFKHLLDSNAVDYNEKVDISEDEQKQPVEQGELNDSEQLMQQTAKDTNEASDSEEANKRMAENNENALEESTNNEIEMGEYMADESRPEDNSRENVSRETSQVVENGKEVVRNEETEQMSESMPEQITELVQSAEEATVETEMHAEYRPERNVLTPEIPAEHDETVQEVTQCTTSEQADLASEQKSEHIEQQFPRYNDTVVERATEKTEETVVEETVVDSTDVCDRSTFESPTVEDRCNKSAEPAAESAEEHASQPLETSTDKDEDHVADSIQSAHIQPNEMPQSVEQVEKVSMQQTNCTEDHLTTSETANEQSDKMSSEDIETEQKVETKQNTEQNEVEVTEVEDEAIRLTENSEGDKRASTEEKESAHHGQGHATDEENIANDGLTAEGANIKEVHEGTERTTDKLVEESDTKFDESIDETNANHPLHADELHTENAMNTAGPRDENATNEYFDEPDKTVQRTIEQSYEAGETKLDEPSGEDKVWAEEAQEEAAKDDEEVHGQESETYETYEMTLVQATVTEVWEENVTTEIVKEESGEVQPTTEILAGEETTVTGENVENAESRNSVEKVEQENEEQTDPTPEVEFQPTIVSNSDRQSEAAATVNECETDVSAATNQPCEQFLDRETLETVADQSKSENAMVKSSAVSMEMCETTERNIQSSETTETTYYQRREITVESHTEQWTYVSETAIEQLDREAAVEDESHFDKEETENPDRNNISENLTDAESHNEHHETEMSRTTEFEEQTCDVSETVEADASFTTVEPCDRNTAEVNTEHVVETEMEIEGVSARENSVTESTEEFNESRASFTQDAQSTEDSEATGNMRVTTTEADVGQRDRKETESHTENSVETSEKESVNTGGGERQTQSVSNNVAFDDAEEQNSNNVAYKHNHLQKDAEEVQHNEEDEISENHDTTTETEKAEGSIADQYNTTGTETVGIEGHTETRQSAEVTATCNGTYESNDNTDEVLEARKTDEVSQQDPEVIVCSQSEEILNHQTEEDNSEPAQLIYPHDSPVSLLNSVEKHESIRSFVDGCRDIELSGIKLATDQVGRTLLRCYFNHLECRGNYSATSISLI